MTKSAIDLVAFSEKKSLMENFIFCAALYSTKQNKGLPINRKLISKSLETFSYFLFKVVVLSHSEAAA